MGNAKLKATKTETIKNVVGETKAVWVSEFSLQGGIDLRDYFAAKAMQSLILLKNWECAEPEVIAGCAYDQADAMLKAREPDKCT